MATTSRQTEVDRARWSRSGSRPPSLRHHGSTVIAWRDPNRGRHPRGRQPGAAARRAQRRHRRPRAVARRSCRHAGPEVLEGLLPLGAEAGSAEAREHGRLANEHHPALRRTTATATGSTRSSSTRPGTG